jgi:nucleoside-diphosphate-sugar epimerase
VTQIRSVDKVLTSTANLGAGHSEAFQNPNVEAMQANLTSEAGIKKAFTPQDGDEKFDIVFNLAAETKYGQTEEVYQEKVLGLSKRAGETAAEFGVSKFIEVSTAQVYSEGKKPSDEKGKLSPWTLLAKYKLQAEEELKNISGLPLIIVRPAVVYGPGDVSGVSPRVITAAVYKHLNEKMKFLWSGDMKINTVHVRDCCAALWTISQKADVGTVWNLADKNQTSQEKINKLLEPIFGIKTGFFGALISNAAKLKLKAVTEEINDKHLKPWSDLCKQEGIINTPLTPYIDQELLYNNSLSVNGSAVESLGFTYKYPNVTEELIREQIKYYVDQNLFPTV